MDKKKIILIVIVITIIAVIAAIAYSNWYNAQFDENLKKASGYQDIALKAMNDDFKRDGTDKIDSFTTKDQIKSMIPSLRNYLNEYDEANKEVKKYLNEAKKYAKNDVEKEYIDLLLKKAEYNDKSAENYPFVLDSLEQYASGNISASEFMSKINALNEKSLNISSKQQEINNDIQKLLTENPDFKRHLSEDLFITQSYLGQRVY